MSRHEARFVCSLRNTFFTFLRQQLESIQSGAEMFFVLIYFPRLQIKRFQSFPVAQGTGNPVSGNTILAR